MGLPRLFVLVNLGLMPRQRLGNIAHVGGLPLTFLFSFCFFLLQNNIDIRRHKTLAERCAAAKLLQQTVELPCPLLVDTIDNETSLSYAAMPIRLYVIENGRVTYAGGPGPINYNLSEVRSYFENWKAAFQESKRVKTKRSCFSRAG